MVQSDEVKKLMDEMMKVTIFQPFEKRRMLEDENKIFLDPNLIMDARHRILHENRLYSSTKSSILTESLLIPEIKGQHLEKEEIFIEKELRKFERDLRRSRPKFCESYTCSRKKIALSDDENFWRTSCKIKVFANKRKDRTSSQKPMVVPRETKQTFPETFIVESKDPTQTLLNKTEDSSFSNIKVIIKDKSSSASEEQRLLILRHCFEAFRKNARNKRRLREIKANIQNIVSRKNLKLCIRTWKLYVESAKKTQKERIMEMRGFEARKIEVLIDNITETQKELTKCPRVEPKRSYSNGITMRDGEVRSKTICKPHIVESPSQNRLNVQKEIIRKQRMKLAEQNKIIEELKLKQIQEEITRANEETVNAAKETLTHCAQQTKRNLIQLLRQAGYKDQSLTTSLEVPDPPRFLVRMEARVEERRNRVKLRKEMRQKKLEEEKKKEEAARREEKQQRKRLQQEALREAKKVREEREKLRAREIERYKKLNAIAEAFYRRYLLRHYIMEPFVALVEMKNHHTKKADDYFKRQLLQKTFVKWRIETERQNQIKIELATSLYNSNILWCALQRWREMTNEERKKKQVANDFFDMKLQNQYFKLWKIKFIHYKTKQLKNEHLALEHYEQSLKIKYYNIWKRYSRLVPDIIESERMKDTWREIVQEIIPDFNPRQRGVILED